MGEEKKEKKEKKEGEEKKEKHKDKEEKKEKKSDAMRKGSTESISEFDQRTLFKEGQKQLTPPVADATRAFYESLLAENPESKIAIKYCVEYGVLPLENHRKVLKKYNHLKDKGAYSISQQIKRALDKKEGKYNKENRENGGKDKK